MDIKAKPTEYAGVLFRSKLEATWARFFDVIGIAWEYEPTTLPGWIPDFLIGGWWLAEVKPIPVMWGDVPSHPPFAKAIRDFDTVLLGDGPGDALWLVVRRLADGKVFSQAVRRPHREDHRTAPFKRVEARVFWPAYGALGGGSGRFNVMAKAFAHIGGHGVISPCLRAAYTQ